MAEPSLSEQLVAYQEQNSSIYQHIGIMASHWAFLEHNVNETIWALANVAPALGACITSQIWTLSGRLLALKSLMKLRQYPEPLIKKVHQFSEKSVSAGNARNRWIHDPVLTSSTGKAGRLEVTSRSEPVFKITEIALGDVASDLKKITECLERWIPLQEKILAALPTLPEIPPSTLHPIRQIRVRGAKGLAND